MAEDDKKNPFEKLFTQKYGDRGKTTRRSKIVIISWLVMLISVFFLLPLVMGMWASGFIYLDFASPLTWFGLILAGGVFILGGFF